ncbi:hypothetical protein COO60DRAFT_1700806 [Scenedesmus sp. NREL 46B-D3]|nr:hypothetical protein COO60DRAFT_1700806 [Scenedesmus sp. NREL 46B-D3]
MCALGTAASSAAAETAAAAVTAAEAITPVDPSAYVPGPVEVGWQIWFAAFVSTVPFVIGAYEFGKRILIQRRCKVCNGSGLVARGKGQRKCPECGGFFPWISWRMFLSANARPGNGGPLLQPRGQTSVFYTVPPPPPADASPPAATTATPQQDNLDQTTATGDEHRQRH